MEWRAPQDPTLPDPTQPADAPTPGTVAFAYLLCATCDRVFPAGGHDPARPAPCPLCGRALRPVAAGPPLEEPKAPPRTAEGTPFGRYLLRRELGRGGMGVVHEAWDTQLGRTVALKMLSVRAGFLDDKASVRLLREARSAARLHHPGVVAIHDVGESEGRPYFTMDLVEGRPLEDLLRPTDSWVSFPMRRRVDALAQVAEALGYAHAQGVVHRDVKPSNIMLDPRGHAMLMDFGLAKELTSTELGQDLTVSGAVLGTPKYMSPEQAGAGREAVGPPSDVFSFGVVLYRAITGALPFTGEGLEAVLAVLAHDPDPPTRVNPRVHRDLETITMRCLEKDPLRRFPNGADLATELRRYLDGEPILSRPTPWAERLWRRAVKRRAVVVPAAAVVVLAVALSYALASRGAQADAAAKSDAGRRAAESRQRAQNEAMTLLERARAALSSAELVLYDKQASYDDLVARVDASQGLIEQAIRACPDLALAHFLLGRAWEVKGWDDKAEAAWKEAIARDSRFAPARYRLGRLYLERAFFGTIGISASQQKWKLPEATRWAKEAEAELGAALASGGGLDDDLQRTLAQAMQAYVAGDHEKARRLCDEGRKAHARDAGREDLLWLGGLCGSGDGAIAALDEAIAIRPKFPTAIFCRAAIRMNMGQHDGAIEGYTEAIRLSPRFTLAYCNRGSERLRQGDAKGAREDFEAALAIEPGFPIALVNRGFMRQDDGDLDGAIADETAAIEATPGCVTAYLNRSCALREKGEIEKSIADCDAVLALEPRNADGLADRAAALAAKGDISGARRDANAAIAIEAKNATALVVRARIRKEAGEIDAAIADFTAAIAGDPRCVSALVDRGSLLSRKGQVDAAREDFEHAIRVSPKVPDGWYGRGTCKGMKGDVAGAIADFDEAIRREPTHAPSLANRGIMKGAQGDLAGGLADAEAAIAADPKNGDGWRSRASIRMLQGDMKRGIEDVTESLRLKPGQMDLVLSRGVARLALGDAKGAIEDMDAILAVEPRNVPARIYRGNAIVSGGDFRGALAEYDAALKIDPESLEANADRGVCLLNLGDLSQAAASLEKALAKAPASWPERAKMEEALKQARAGR